MPRLLMIIVIFLFSFLTIFKAPTNLLWYASILITECSWVFFVVVVLLLLWPFGAYRYKLLSFIIGGSSLFLLALPIVSAWRMSHSVKLLFNQQNLSNNIKDLNEPFNLLQMVTGINAQQSCYKIYRYDTTKMLTLDFYPSVLAGKKPCIVVVHGGSWSGGDSRQLPELNSELAKNGYNVATINYRLAPKFKYPAPIEDVKAALDYLKIHADELAIDTNNFVLLGRSAGAQIVLQAAYTQKDADVKGVISFYGPADMVWGYEHPANKMVFNSSKVLEDYLGGTYKEVPEQYTNSSPFVSVTAHVPPTLLLHGEDDPLVSYLHDARLSEKLHSLGATYYSIFFPWATHGFDWTLNGPAGQLSTWSVLQFLKLVVKR